MRRAALLPQKGAREIPRESDWSWSVDTRIRPVDWHPGPKTEGPGATGAPLLGTAGRALDPAGGPGRKAVRAAAWALHRNCRESTGQAPILQPCNDTRTVQHKRERARKGEERGREGEREKKRYKAPHFFTKDLGVHPAPRNLQAWALLFMVKFNAFALPMHSFVCFVLSIFRSFRFDSFFRLISFFGSLSGDFLGFVFVYFLSLRRGCQTDKTNDCEQVNHYSITVGQFV